MKARVKLDDGRWVEAELWWFGKPGSPRLCVRYSREDVPEGRLIDGVSPDNVVPRGATIKFVRDTMTAQDRADLAGWAKYWRRRFVENREAKKRKAALAQGKTMAQEEAEYHARYGQNKSFWD